MKVYLILQLQFFGNLAKNLFFTDIDPMENKLTLGIDSL